MRIKYDKIADAMFIYLRKGIVAKTVKVNSRFLVDMDGKGNVIGIEMLGISKQVPKREIGRIYTEMPVYA